MNQIISNKKTMEAIVLSIAIVAAIGTTLSAYADIQSSNNAPLQYLPGKTTIVESGTAVLLPATMAPSIGGIVHQGTVSSGTMVAPPNGVVLHQVSGEGSIILQATPIQTK
jgi:hypothetical protein